MKIKLTFVVFICTFSLFSSCSRSQRERAKLDIETEIIDFWSFEQSESTIPESMIREKKYILLDNSNDDFLFKKIDKIKIINDHIYVLDQRLKKLIVFNLTGIGLGKVGQLGQGPEDYLQIADFDVDSRGNIYLIDAMGGNDRLFIFNKNFQFISVRQLPFEADIIQCLLNGNLMFGLSSWNKGIEENTKIVVVNTALGIEKSYMQYDEYRDDSYWISGYTFVNEGNNIQYNKPIDNYVYQ